MRGKAFHTKNSLLLIRITPAYAGKSTWIYSTQPNPQDHPRLCGEKASISNLNFPLKGSPPPMRGKVYRRISADPIHQDHPRLCGEKANPPAATIFRTGSPPPMRGKGYSSDRQTEQSRITPAYAGKSIQDTVRHGSNEDHPRLCGEKAFPEVQLTQISGSPPPMRGKAFTTIIPISDFGITPAYAGKSFGCC